MCESCQCNVQCGVCCVHAVVVGSVYYLVTKGLLLSRPDLENGYKNKSILGCVRTEGKVRLGGDRGGGGVFCMRLN